MTLTHDLWIRAVGVVVLFAATFLLVAPVHANYIANFDFGSDLIVHSSASCGAPIFSVFGAEPKRYDASAYSGVIEGPHGDSPRDIGAVNSKQACSAASGRRVTIGLGLLLVVSLGLWRTKRRPKRLATLPDDVATTET